jgi:hypothetical protein
MITQEQFDRFVQDYNEDYLLLLTRASRRQYYCLISSFLVLKDLYNVISVLYDSGELTYQVLPYPNAFRANDVFLNELGFNNEEVSNIYGFLEFVAATQGLEFEQVLERGTVATCARVKRLETPSGH